MKWLNASFLLAWFAMIPGAAHTSQGPHSGMMSEGMMGGGMMMIGCVLLGVLFAVFLMLSIFALIKYLRSDRHPRP